MYPVLLEIAGHKVNSYGLMVAIGHLLGVALVLWTSHRRGWPLEPYVDLLFAVMLAAVVGARAGYIWGHPEEFTGPKDWLLLWKGGLSLFAGLLCGFPAYLALLRWHRLPVWETTDLLVPILPLSLGIIRLGCFAAGCCYGIPTSLPWGMVPMSDSIPYHLAGEALHPTQLYEAIFLFSLSFLLWRRNRLPRIAGVNACLFLLAYGLFRLAENPLRADLEPVPGLGFSAAQASAGLLVILSAGTLYWRLRGARSSDENESRSK